MCRLLHSSLRKLRCAPRCSPLAMLLLPALFLLVLHLPPSPLSRRVRASHSQRQLLHNDSYLHAITRRNQDLVYVAPARLLVVAAAKSGTSSLFQLLYRGVTGSSLDHTPSRCGTYVQNVSSGCWQGRASFVHQHPLSEQRFILSSERVLRVAVTRNPFERLVSAFKSKASCEALKYNTNKRNRATIVPTLRRLAALPQGEPCMNVSEFALALHLIRLDARVDVHELDVHLRPARLFTSAISYDVLLDVADLSNVSALDPIIRRLPFGRLVAGGVPHRHASGSYELLLPELAARRLLAFAELSERAPVPDQSSTST